MGKVLITGISGNVGIAVYESLLNLKEKVVGGVTNLEKYQGKFEGAELVRFNFQDVGTFEQALEGVDRVFLMRPPNLGKPEDLYPFIDAMKQKDIKLVVFLSLMGIEKNTIPPHHKIEKYIEQAGLSYCHIRPGFFMQNLTGIHAYEIKEFNEIFIPAGKSSCSFIDTKDIGEAIAVVLANDDQHQNSAYTLTGEESLDYYQIAKLLSEVLHRDISYKAPSFIRFWFSMVFSRRIPMNMANVMVMLYFMTRLGTGSPIFYDFEKITGKKPRSFKDFAEENRKEWL